jgi:hypothetical protein
MIFYFPFLVAAAAYDHADGSYTVMVSNIWGPLLQLTRNM